MFNSRNSVNLSHNNTQPQRDELPAKKNVSVSQFSQIKRAEPINPVNRLVQPTMMQKRLSSLPAQQHFQANIFQIQENKMHVVNHYTQQIKVAGQVERHRSPQPNEIRLFQDNQKSEDIQNKLKMLNMKLSQTKQINVTVKPVSGNNSAIIRNSSILHEQVPIQSLTIKEESPQQNDSSNKKKKIQDLDESSQNRVKQVSLSDFNQDKNLQAKKQNEAALKSTDHLDHIIQAKSIHLPIKNNLPQEKESVNKKHAMIIIDSSPKSVTNNKKIYAFQQRMQSPKLLKNTQSDYTLTESLRASVFSQEDAPKDKNLDKLTQQKKISNKSSQNLNANLKKASLQKLAETPLKSRQSDNEVKFRNKKDTQLTPDIFVEIYDKPQKQDMSDACKTPKDSSQQSLAEVFKQKMNVKSLQNLERRQQQSQSHQVSTIIGKDQNKKEQKQEKERTKLELLELRKKMMKSTVREKKDNFAVEQNKDSKSKDMPHDLMQRLSKGQKIPIDSKEMKKLNHKNYENLPEIKKKKEDEKKKEDYKQRQQQVRKYAEELDKKRKQMYYKKQATLANSDLI